MALKSKSLLLYGYVVEVANQYIDFKGSSAGPILTAVIQQGNYSLTDLMNQIALAMNALDGTNTYTVTADRTINGGTENRVSISTSGTFLSLLFGSGAHAAASVASTIGFLETDQTGQTSYTGVITTGSSIVPVMQGYNWVSPKRNRKNFGSVNVAASGLKESIVFQLQQFFRVEFRYEPESVVDQQWQLFFDWAIQQQDLEFTPEITQPSVFYNCTLESTEEDGQGLAWEMKEMLPEFPALYQTGELNFRVNLVSAEFLTGV